MNKLTKVSDTVKEVEVAMFDEADRRGHGRVTRAAVAGACIGALLGSLFGVISAAVGGALGAWVGTRVGLATDTRAEEDE